MKLEIIASNGEKIAALKTVEWLCERGQNADANDLAVVLALVPEAEPKQHDRFPLARRT